MIQAHNPFWPRHAFRFKGGSNPGNPTTYAPPAPPTAANAASIQAQADARQKALEEQGVSSTLLKGNGGQGAAGGGDPGLLAAGSAFMPNTSQPKNTLLGGG